MLVISHTCTLQQLFSYMSYFCRTTALQFLLFPMFSKSLGKPDNIVVQYLLHKCYKMRIFFYPISDVPWRGLIRHSPFLNFWIILGPALFEVPMLSSYRVTRLLLQTERTQAAFKLHTSVNRLYTVSFTAS